MLVWVLRFPSFQFHLLVLFILRDFPFGSPTAERTLEEGCLLRRERPSRPKRSMAYGEVGLDVSEVIALVIVIAGVFHNDGGVVASTDRFFNSVEDFIAILHWICCP